MPLLREFLKWVPINSFSTLSTYRATLLRLRQQILRPKIGWVLKSAKESQFPTKRRERSFGISQKRSEPALHLPLQALARRQSPRLQRTLSRMVHPLTVIKQTGNCAFTTKTRVESGGEYDSHDSRALPSSLDMRVTVLPRHQVAGQCCT